MIVAFTLKSSACNANIVDYVRSINILFFRSHQAINSQQTELLLSPAGRFKPETMRRINVVQECRVKRIWSARSASRRSHFFSSRSARRSPTQRQPHDVTDDEDNHTPIKHVIVIIGENRSFDHVFATYVPKHGQTVWNLLSEGIVKADGTSRAKFCKAQQTRRPDQAADAFLLNPPKIRFPSNSAAGAAGGRSEGLLRSGRQPAASRSRSENGLPDDYYQYLVTGGTGQTPRRRTRASRTSTRCRPGRSSSPTAHVSLQRLCREPGAPLLPDVAAARLQPRACDRENPSGCDAALFSWVEVTVGAGTNGAAQPAVELQHRIFAQLPTRPPAKAPRRSASTTCSRATRRTSRASPTTTR